MIDFDVDIRDVVHGFDSMKRAARNLRPVWQALEPVAKQDQREHARLQSGPRGPWAPLAASTQESRSSARRAKKAGRTRARRSLRGRKVLGRLPSLVAVEFDSQRFLTLSKVPWSGAHQDGAIVGKGARLSAREHVYFSDEFQAVAARLLTAHLERAF